MECGRPARIPHEKRSAPFAEYKYDDDGRRIQKKVNGTITNYIYDGDNLDSGPEEAC
jgi:hypothetical protein